MRKQGKADQEWKAGIEVERHCSGIGRLQIVSESNGKSRQLGNDVVAIEETERRAGRFERLAGVATARERHASRDCSHSWNDHKRCGNVHGEEEADDGQRSRPARGFGQRKPDDDRGQQENDAADLSQRREHNKGDKPKNKHRCRPSVVGSCVASVAVPGQIAARFPATKH